MLLLIVILISTIYISYGFVSGEIRGNETSKKVLFNSQLLKIEFSGGDESLASNLNGQFLPGSEITKTFTIKNTGNMKLEYSINTPYKSKLKMN